MKWQSGFTLIDMAIVLVIIGLIAVGALKAASAIRENTGISETAKRTDTVVTALRTFLVHNNRLPCPARADLSETAPNYVVEARTGGNCDASTQVGGTNAHRGVLPVRSLGLSRLPDAWDRQFTYEVTLEATQDDSFTSGTWPTQFDLQDESGNDLNLPDPAGNGVVVIMSHGNNGSGAFLTTGMQMDAPPPTAVNELANLDTDFVFSSASYSSDATNPFDDQVLVLTEDQIVEPLAERGVLKNKRTQALEKLKRIDSALFSFMIGDVYDNDGPPTPPPCTCGGPTCTQPGCVRSVRRRVPFADTDGNGTEDTGTNGGGVPYVGLNLANTDVIDPWGNPINYQIGNAIVANSQDRAPAPYNQGVFSGTPPAANPVYTITSNGPDGTAGSGDDVTLSRQHPEIAGALAQAGIKVD